MRPPYTWIAITISAVIAFWSLFVSACAPDSRDDPEPVARLLTIWDPLTCGDPHRVAIDLQDESGNEVKSSTPCWLGGIAIDMPSWGPYTGRIYAWADGGIIRSVTPLSVSIDESVIRVNVLTPK